MMTERRHSENIMKAVVMPVVVAVVTGIGASYLATKVTVAVLQKQVEYLEGDLLSIRNMIDIVSQNQRELVALNVWRDSKNQKDGEQDVRLMTLERRAYINPAAGQ